MGADYKELVLGEEFMDLLREPESVPAAEAPEAGVDALGERLEANLRAQLGLYREYLAAGDRQKTAMVNRRLADNQAINAEIERLLGGLGALEAERLDIVSRIAAARPGLPSDPAAVKCEALCAHFGPGLARRVLDARAALVESVADLKRLMAVNRALVENGSRIIHTTVGIMTSVVGRTKDDKMATTYTRKGAINVGKVQVRNLINRSV
jgi:hypothetical protein